MRRMMVAALTAVAVVAALAAPAHAAFQTAVCVPTASRPTVSTGSPNIATSEVGFAVYVRHAQHAPISAVTVRVRVSYNGQFSHYDTVTVPQSPVLGPNQGDGNRVYRRTMATLAVPRRTGDLTASITIREDSSYGRCKPNAGVSFPRETPVYSPPPTTTLPETEADTSVEEDRYPRPEPAENPTNSDGTPNLYGPGGLLTDERRLAWQCWAAFGNTEALQEAGIISQDQSC